MVLRWLRTAVHERPWEVRLLVPQYLRTGTVTMLRSMNAGRFHRTGQVLDRVRVPVVVVRGVHDRIVPADWAAHLADGPNRLLVTAAEAGHMVPLTRADEVARAVDRVRRWVRPRAPDAARPGDVPGWVADG